MAALFYSSQPGIPVIWQNPTDEKQSKSLPISSFLPAASAIRPGERSISGRRIGVTPSPSLPVFLPVAIARQKRPRRRNHNRTDSGLPFVCFVCFFPPQIDWWGECILLLLKIVLPWECCCEILMEGWGKKCSSYCLWPDRENRMLFIWESSRMLVKHGKQEIPDLLILLLQIAAIYLNRRKGGGDICPRKYMYSAFIFPCSTNNMLVRIN